MFMAHVQWRKEFGADTLDQFVFQERDAIISLYPQGYHKTDKMVGFICLQLLKVRIDVLGDFRSHLYSASFCMVDSPVHYAPWPAVQLENGCHAG